MSASGPEEEKVERPAGSGAPPEERHPVKGASQPSGKKEPVGEGGDPGNGEEGQPHPYESLLDEYPLRDPSEDPVWSVRIIRWWMWFLLVTTGGLLLLLILGIWFD